MDEDMETFLRRRGVQEDVIAKMKRNKQTQRNLSGCSSYQLIDRLVVQVDDNILNQYLEVGDVVALKHYCKAPEKQDNSTRKTKKESILNKLRRKVNFAGKNTGTDSDGSGEEQPTRRKKKVGHLMGNSNALKRSRIIEIGWINYRNGDNCYHQVRAKNGGIPRKQTIDKDATKEAILQIAKEKFFPRGKSKFGCLEDFEIDLLDFCEEQLLETETVAQMYDRTGIKRLRFNLATKAKSTKSQCNTPETVTTDKKSDDKVTACNDELLSTPEKGTQSVVNRSKRIVLPDLHKNSPPCSALMNTFIPPSVLCVDDSDSDTEITFQKSPVVDNDETLPYLPKLDCNQNVNLIALAAAASGIDMTEESDPNENIDRDSLTTIPRTPTPPNLTDDTTARYLKIRRVLIEHEMVANFIDPLIMNENLKFQFIDEKGVDAEGVSREAYTTFWSEFLEKSAVGEAERVPIVKASMQRPEWEAVGRILAKGFTDHGVFPLKLCKVFAIAVIHGEEHIFSNHMMESFLNYIAVMEKDVVTKAIAGNLEEDDDKDEFIDLLDRIGCKTIPHNDEVKATILNIAYKELIHIPKYSLDAIASTARKYLALKLPTVDSVINIYEAKLPTNKKVIRLFQPQESGREEERSMGFLKQYVKGLDAETLKRFLRHVTGSDMICVDKIEVHFNKRRGLSRVPVVRTCTPMIELSTTYSTYTDMRAEFTELLTMHHPLDID